MIAEYWVAISAAVLSYLMHWYLFTKPEYQDPCKKLFDQLIAGLVYEGTPDYDKFRPIPKSQLDELLDKEIALLETKVGVLIQIRTRESYIAAVQMDILNQLKNIKRWNNGIPVEAK